MSRPRVRYLFEVFLEAVLAALAETLVAAAWWLIQRVIKGRKRKRKKDEDEDE